MRSIDAFQKSLAKYYFIKLAPRGRKLNPPWWEPTLVGLKITTCGISK